MAITFSGFVTNVELLLSHKKNDDKLITPLRTVVNTLNKHTQQHQSDQSRWILYELSEKYFLKVVLRDNTAVGTQNCHTPFGLKQMTLLMTKCPLYGQSWLGKQIDDKLEYNSWVQNTKKLSFNKKLIKKFPAKTSQNTKNRFKDFPKITQKKFFSLSLKDVAFTFIKLQSKQLQLEFAYEDHETKFYRLICEN